MREQLIKSIRPKIAKYCAYRERASREVMLKLLSYGLQKEEAKSVLQELTEEGFVDDLRFAKAYAGGKFRLKKWGKLKIRRELKQRDIAEDHINEALSEIEGQTYLETLEQMANSKFESINQNNLYTKKNKVAAYLVSKGYESELVWGILNKIS